MVKNKQNETKPTGQSPRRLFILVSYAVWLSVSLRWISEFIEQEHPLTGVITVMLSVYGILLGVEPRLRPPRQRHAYLLLQTALVLTAALFFYELDFFALLFLPLAGQAALTLPERPAYGWLGLLIAATFVGQLTQFGWPGGLPFIFLYVAGILFVGAFSRLMLRAEAAQAESERLLAELRRSHAQLQAYAGQAEELAIARERNRLAQELHDSVAQTLYGFTLELETAARRLGEDGAAETGAAAETIAGQLRLMGGEARQTLREMRRLIHELRPPDLENDGLVPALQTRLAHVEERGGIHVVAELDDIGQLPPALEMALYRIAQEALNNVLKHAGANRVIVRLWQTAAAVHLDVVDDGQGFDPAGQNAGLGLAGMRERAAAVGGALELEQLPAGGTRLAVRVPHV